MTPIIAPAKLCSFFISFLHFPWRLPTFEQYRCWFSSNVVIQPILVASRYLFLSISHVRWNFSARISSLHSIALNVHCTISARSWVEICQSYSISLLAIYRWRMNGNSFLAMEKMQASVGYIEIWIEDTNLSERPDAILDEILRKIDTIHINIQKAHLQENTKILEMQDTTIEKKSLTLIQNRHRGGFINIIGIA